jgi:hypothetical protein
VLRGGPPGRRARRGRRGALPRSGAGGTTRRLTHLREESVLKRTRHRTADKSERRCAGVRSDRVFSPFAVETGAAIRCRRTVTGSSPPCGARWWT